MFNSLWQKTFKGELINLNNLEDYKNYTVTQLKDTINNNPYAPMSELYRLVWEKENTLSHAIGLVRSLRKEKKFDIGKEFHDKFQKRYPDTKQLESERLWFIFSSKVCNSSNDSYIDDADNLLKLCSQDDPRTNLIFEVTTLFTSSRLIKDKKYSEAYQWLSTKSVMTSGVWRVFLSGPLLRRKSMDCNPALQVASYARTVSDGE